MRRPNLLYLLRKDFTALLREDFFSTQQIMHGKSFQDICMSDSHLIHEGLHGMQPLEKFKITGTLIELIAERNAERLKILQQMNFMPVRQPVLSIDFNFNTQILRGIKLNTLNSVRYILEFIRDNEGS